MKIQILQSAVPVITLFVMALSFGSETTPKGDLMGTISRSELDAQNYEWMAKGELAAAKEFHHRKKDIATLKYSLKGVEIEVYFGSWCGDSKEHVPTFLTLMDSLRPEGAKEISMVALDRKKMHPGFTNSRNIEKLPTFVFLKGGKEIGRIVETPTKSVLDDTLAIVKSAK